MNITKIFFNKVYLNIIYYFKIKCKTMNYKIYLNIMLNILNKNYNLV